MANYNKFGFIIYEFKYRGITENVDIEDIEGKIHEIGPGDRIYFLGGAMFCHDTHNDQLIKFKMSSDEFDETEICEHFMSL